MEYQKLSKIEELCNRICQEFCMKARRFDGGYEEVESIFFLAAVTRFNSLPMSLKSEEDAKRYFNEKEIEGIRLEDVFQNIQVYGSSADDLYHELIKLDEQDLSDIFEHLETLKDAKSGRYMPERATTSEIAELIFRLFDKKEKYAFLDICSGEGRVLAEAEKNGYKLFKGYELNPSNALISKIRGVIHGEHFDITMCDVLQEKMSKIHDVVFTQPPFALRTFKATVKDEDETLKYSESDRTIKADWHFVFKAINSIRKGGVAIALVTSGALLNTPDSFYRKQVVDNKLLQTVIQLPSGIIPMVGISTALLVFSENNDSVNFIDASECFMKIKGYDRKLDVEAVTKLLHEGGSKTAKVSYDELKNDDNYPFTVGKYLNDGIVCQMENPVPIKDYAEVIPGFQYTTSRITELEPGVGSINVVKITNLENGSIDYDNLVSIDVDEEKVIRYLLRDNDILVSTKGTALKFALVESIGNRKVVHHSNLTVIRCNEGLEPLYLISFLKSEVGTTMFKSIQTGSIIMNITQKAIENFCIPMVDMDTQKVIASRHRIISKQIEGIKKELNAAEKKLSTLWEDEVGE